MEEMKSIEHKKIDQAELLEEFDVESRFRRLSRNSTPGMIVFSCLCWSGIVSSIHGMDRTPCNTYAQGCTYDNCNGTYIFTLSNDKEL